MNKFIRPSEKRLDTVKLSQGISDAILLESVFTLSGGNPESLSALVGVISAYSKYTSSGYDSFLLFVKLDIMGIYGSSIRDLFYFNQNETHSEDDPDALFIDSVTDLFKKEGFYTDEFIRTHKKFHYLKDEDILIKPILLECKIDSEKCSLDTVVRNNFMKKFSVSSHGSSPVTATTIFDFDYDDYGINKVNNFLVSLCGFGLESITKMMFLSTYSDITDISKTVLMLMETDEEPHEVIGNVIRTVSQDPESVENEILKSLVGGQEALDKIISDSIDEIAKRKN